MVHKTNYTPTSQLISDIETYHTMIPRHRREAANTRFLASVYLNSDYLNRVTNILINTRNSELENSYRKDMKNTAIKSCLIAILHIAASIALIFSILYPSPDIQIPLSCLCGLGFLTSIFLMIFLNKDPE